MFSASSFFAPTYQSSLINKHDQVFSHSPPFYRLPPLDASEPELRRRRRPSHLHQPRPLHQPVLTRELRHTSAVQQLQYVFLFSNIRSALGFLRSFMFFIVHHGFFVVLPPRSPLIQKWYGTHAVVVLRPFSILADPFCL